MAVSVLCAVLFTLILGASTEDCPSGIQIKNKVLSGSSLQLTFDVSGYDKKWIGFTLEFGSNSTFIGCRIGDSTQQKGFSHRSAAKKLQPSTKAEYKQDEDNKKTCKVTFPAKGLSDNSQVQLKIEMADVVQNNITNNSICSKKLNLKVTATKAPTTTTTTTKAPTTTTTTTKAPTTTASTTKAPTTTASTTKAPTTTTTTTKAPTTAKKATTTTTTTTPKPTTTTIPTTTTTTPPPTTTKPTTTRKASITTKKPEITTEHFIEATDEMTTDVTEPNNTTLPGGRSAQLQANGGGLLTLTMTAIGAGVLQKIFL